ncbi:MAG: hypothetical protein IAA97_03900 [Spirochaetes bacterium]|uniref:Uncharacterized protein n=1 Tax=Candidatus Ornithospirochaeta stercoripullorum TaxID=2840899 RepID=A0A9D9H5Z7_9SPIO|nr:hypothetical protein [Candidatus Ornithospirochaeta stercoripullorum]
MEETDRKHYRTKEELRLALFSYIDGCYNSKMRLKRSSSRTTANLFFSLATMTAVHLPCEGILLFLAI